MDLKLQCASYGLRFFEAGFEERTGILDVGSRRLWAMNSTSGGRYVSIDGGDTSQSWPTNLHVTASGEVDTTAITNVEFNKYISGPGESNPMIFIVQPWYNLKFTQGGPDYTIIASEKEVKADQAIAITDGSIFRVFALFPPNDPYVVIASNKKDENGNNLYLSSDGAGKMKLKAWSSSIPGPPHTTDEVDPALLFRIVRP